MIIIRKSSKGFHKDTAYAGSPINIFQRFMYVEEKKCAIFCDIVLWKILHDFRETFKTENMFILTFIRKKTSQYDATDFAKKNLSHDIFR